MEGKIINYNELKFEILNEKPKIVIALNIQVLSGKRIIFLIQK